MRGLLSLTMVGLLALSIGCDGSAGFSCADVQDCIEQDNSCPSGEELFCNTSSSSPGVCDCRADMGTGGTGGSGATGGSGGTGAVAGMGGTGGMGGSAVPCDPPPADRFVLIEDDVFADDDWTFSASMTEGAMITLEPTGQLPSGGVGDSSYRRMTHQIVNPAVGAPGCEQPPPEDATCRFGLTAGHQYVGGPTYTPSEQGAIEYIDYSEAHIITEPAFEGAAVGWTFALWQSGTRFVYVNPDNAFRDLSWTTAYACGMRVEDFVPAPGPDFSSTGEEMVFGYIRSNTNTAPDTTQRNVHGVDDYSVIVVQQ
ncbi:MAG: hypothetical protein AAF500_15775 [Myxococcota bacterium]